MLELLYIKAFIRASKEDYSEEDSGNCVLKVYTELCPIHNDSGIHVMTLTIHKVSYGLFYFVDIPYSVLVNNPSLSVFSSVA